MMRLERIGDYFRTAIFSFTQKCVMLCGVRFCEWGAQQLGLDRANRAPAATVPVASEMSRM